MVKNIREDKMSHQANNINKDRNYTKNQRGILILKSVIVEVKNSLHPLKGLSSRFEAAEERISEFEDKLTKYVI